MEYNPDTDDTGMFLHAVEGWLPTPGPTDTHMVEAAHFTETQIIEVGPSPVITGLDPTALQFGMLCDCSRFTDMIDMVDSWWDVLSECRGAHIALLHRAKDTERADRIAETLQQLFDDDAKIDGVVSIRPVALPETLNDMRALGQELNGIIQLSDNPSPPQVLTQRFLGASVFYAPSELTALLADIAEQSTFVRCAIKESSTDSAAPVETRQAESAK